MVEGYNPIPINKELIYSEIRDYRFAKDMQCIRPFVLQKVAELETGEDYESFKNPAEWWEDTAEKGKIILSSFPLNGLLSRLLALHFGDSPFPDRDPCISPAWQSRVKDYYVDAVDDVVYFVHEWSWDWIDRDLLGGNGNGSARRKFEDKITLTMVLD